MASWAGREGGTCRRVVGQLGRFDVGEPGPEAAVADVVERSDDLGGAGDAEDGEDPERVHDRPDGR